MVDHVRIKIPLVKPLSRKLQHQVAELVIRMGKGFGGIRVVMNEGSERKVRPPVSYLPGCHLMCRSGPVNLLERLDQALLNFVLMLLQSGVAEQQPQRGETPEPLFAKSLDAGIGSAWVYIVGGWDMRSGDNVSWPAAHEKIHSPPAKLLHVRHDDGHMVQRPLASGQSHDIIGDVRVHRGRNLPH